MKSLVLRGMSVISLALFSFGCSTSDDSNNNNNNNNNSAQIAAIETAAESGTWRVASFIDSGVDETQDFVGYDFTFASDGSVTATNGTNTVTGVWSVTDSSNSSDDSSNDDDIDFNMTFAVSPESDFEDLNDDWDVVSYSSTQIQLIDISGGNGGTDTLTFQKN